MASPTLADTIDSLCQTLGIVEWHYEPVPHDGFCYSATFKCSVCRERKTHRVLSGPVDDVIGDLYRIADEHRCDIVLGKAGEP